MTRFAFTIDATDGKARTGTIAMRRGSIRTPAFMPVGTAATVKAMKPGDVAAAGADIILGNTYHLMLRPGAERVARLGGLHAFMGWVAADPDRSRRLSGDEPRRADQALARRASSFKSHLDGSRHLLSPSARSRSSACSARTSSWRSTSSCRPPRPARCRRRRWSARCAGRSGRATPSTAASEHAEAARALRYPAGRARRGAARGHRADALIDIGFDGYAIGGLAVGEGQEAMFACLDYRARPARPRTSPAT